MAAVTAFFGDGIPGRPAPYRETPRAAITRARRATPIVFWRRRLAVVAIALGLVVVVAQAGDALGGSPLAAPERRPAASQTWVDVRVRPGDSPWSIVERTFPGSDPRPRVDQLVEARRGAPLVPGEVIQVPR
ncbi:MAG: hypothetical protein FJW95_02205 [Actinobacteria bacterium]|nr:hypothetical protein [Actinomycetota bacterium]